MPAMLRLGLIENVRRMALRTVHRLDEIEAADAWAAGCWPPPAARAASLEAARSTASRPIRRRSRRPSSPASFTSSGLEGAALPALVRLEQWIAEEALSAEEATARATQRLALTQVVMANSITSLRAIARMDWKTFVERQSLMEAVLREDPSGFYALMTFATRDHYRHVVERIARRTGGARRAWPATRWTGARLRETRRRTTTRRSISGTTSPTTAGPSSSA